MPEVENLQDIAAVTTGAQEEVTPSVDQNPPEESETSTTDAGEKTERKHWAQRRIDELTRLRRDAERDRDAWRDLATTAKPQAEPQKAAAPAAGKPIQTNFSTYEDYVEAVADWKAETKIAAATQRFQSELESREQERETQNHQEKLVNSWESKQQKAREIYADFDDTISNPDVPLSPAMTHAILNSKQGAELAYYLGKNEVEARRIANLAASDPDGTETFLEMGRIAARIADKGKTEETVQTRAPRPPSHLNQSSKTDAGLRDDLSPEEWHRRWKALKAKG